MIKALLTVSCLLASGGCVVGDDGATSDSADDGSAIDGGDGDGDAALTAGLSSGVNGKACLHSPYNCKFRVEGGNAIDNAEGGLWSVADSPILDGLGQ